MFEQFDSFQQAFGASPGSGQPPRSNSKPMKRRRSFGEFIVFWGLNSVILPLVVLCYLTVGAEGLRQTMEVFQTRFYRLPIPGAGMLRNYDGFDRLDLALPMAFVLFVAVTMLWIRVFKELQSDGNLANQRNRNPILFYLLAGIVAVVVLGDAGIFYAGLSSTVASNWNETAEYVPLIATVIYSAGLALLGAWHADYHQPGGA